MMVMFAGDVVAEAKAKELIVAETVAVVVEDAAEYAAVVAVGLDDVA